MKKLLSFVLAAIILSAFILLPVSAATPWVINPDGKYYGAKQDGTSVTPAPGVTCRGIDVSVHNGKIDWEKIYEQYKAGTISFVIIRCGYGMDIESQDDTNWKTNADACTKYGIPFGAYLYSYATTLDSARSEAAHALRLLKGYTLTYPIYYDVENSKTQSGLGSDFFVQICDIFCGTMLENGYETGIYSMRSWINDNNYLGKVDCDAKHYSRWVAEFGPKLNYSGTYDIWQCTSTAVVDGIKNPASADYPNGRCDVSFSYIPVRTTDHLYVTFNMNGDGGTAPAPIHTNKGEPFGTLPKAVSASGEPFGGWYTQPVGGQPVTSETVATLSGKQTLYAHWHQTVTFEVENAEITSGSATQGITVDSPFKPVTFKAKSGYYLPSRLTLPNGLTWTKNADGSVTVTGTPNDEFVFRIAAVPDDTLEAPIAEDYTVTPANHGKENGVVTGFTTDLEILLPSGWHKVSATNEKNGFFGLAPAEYEIRRSAADGKKASSSVVIKVKERLETPDVSDFKVTQPTLSVPSGDVELPDGNIEYSIDGGDTFVSAASGVVTGIEGWTKALFRFAGTDEYAESFAVEIPIVPVRTEGYINFSREQIYARTDRQVLLVNGVEVKSDDMGIIPIPEDSFGKTVTLELAANHGKKNSVILELAVPARPAAPKCITVTDETYAGQGNGSLTGYNSDMQYSTDGGEKWIQITNATVAEGIDFELDKTYLFRYKPISVGKESFASEVCEATINSGRMIKVTYKAESFDDIVFELRYGETVTVPDLPEFKYCNMEESYWDVDLNGVAVTEDVTVNAVYAKTFCSYIPFLYSAVMIICSFCTAAAVIFRKRA